MFNSNALRHLKNKDKLMNWKKISKLNNTLSTNFNLKVFFLRLISRWSKTYWRKNKLNWKHKRKSRSKMCWTKTRWKIKYIRSNRFYWQETMRFISRYKLTRSCLSFTSNYMNNANSLFIQWYMRIFRLTYKDLMKK